ncbi:MAG: hypothetical protein ACR2QO_17335 [Acidimicrobiales bacterium]
MNIWKDADAAAFVATYRYGNETVPTAVTGAGVMVEATPKAIREQLAANRRSD